MTANRRIRPTTRDRLTEAAYEDPEAMLRFPPVPPDPSWQFSIRSPSDHYGRSATNDSAEKPRLDGRRVKVGVTRGEVTDTYEGTEVARTTVA